MKEIVIVDGARTPMAEYNGHFSDISACIGGGQGIAMIGESYA